MQVRIFSRIFALAAVFLVFWGLTTSFCLEITAPLLFDQMEARSEKIDSLIARLFLSSGKLSNQVEMLIQSPDKFSIDFLDNSSRIVFDGERLWIYVSSLSEVFTYDGATSGGWLSDILRDWINPKKMATQITRKTLFTLFDVDIVPASSSYSASSPVNLDSQIASFPKSCCVRFTPLGGDVMKKIFDIGYYEVDFSLETFLPLYAREYTQEGILRGTLKVVEYRINDQIPKERFIFSVPDGVKEVPLSKVFLEKLEQSKENIWIYANDLWKSIKKRITDWGI